MKKPKPYKHVKTYKVKGRWYRYFRHPKIEGKIKLPLDLESREGREAYDTCMRMIEDRPNEPLRQGSVGMLISLYKKSPEFKSKAPETRRQYDLFLARIDKVFRHVPVAGISRGIVLGIRNKMADTPRAANYMIQVISVLMSFAIDHEWRTDNPAMRIKKLETGTGSEPWTLLHLQKIRRVADPDFLRVVAALLFTGMRQGDAIRFATADVTKALNSGVFKVVHRKTGKEAWPSVHPVWRRIIQNSPVRGPLLLTQPDGRPWNENRLQKLCRKYVVAAGIEEKITLHGLGKTAIGALADAGCTEEEIEAATGKSPAMIKRYIAKTIKKKRAQKSGQKLAKATVTKLDSR